MYKENIGSKLKKYREKNKLSISEVADKLNIKESKIEKFESDIKKPNLYQIKKLSNLYNIDMNNIIESKKIVDEVILRRRLDILEFLTITILIILFCINILNKNVTTNSTNIYKFSGDSDHFKFDNGIYVSGSNKYIDISNFDIKDDTEYKSITINIAFNESIWKVAQYKDEDKTSKEWLNNVSFNEYGENDDSFSKYKDTFPNDFKVEINYCTINDECSIEILDIKE